MNLLKVQSSIRDFWPVICLYTESNALTSSLSCIPSSVTVTTLNNAEIMNVRKVTGKSQNNNILKLTQANFLINANHSIVICYIYMYVCMYISDATNFMLFTFQSVCFFLNLTVQNELIVFTDQ